MSRPSPVPFDMLCDERLEAAILESLAPRSLRERFRLRLTKGYTPLQVWERLVARGLAEPSVDPLAARAAIERVRARMVALRAAGRLESRPARMTIRFNTKGPRDVLVDVYRLSAARLP